MAIKRKILSIAAIVLLAATLTACSAGKTSETKAPSAINDTSAIEAPSEIKYHFADRDEAVACYLSNEAYFQGFSLCDIQYKTQKKSGTIQELKEFGASQMEEFTDAEKAALEKSLEEMQTELREKGYSLPALEEITFIKSTQEEECGSGAYTHGTNIFLGQYIINLIGSGNEDKKLYGQCILWHEIFHCLTRNNPEFRRDMYRIIHFTVQDREYPIPPSGFEKYISNPDVGHHNAYAAFRIHGEDVDCFVVLIATEPFENAGDSFFDCMSAALVPIDGSDVYYLPEEAENFWEIFGENTGYVIDPEECMADNFGYALTYGADGLDYPSPEIIREILEVLSAGR